MKIYIPLKIESNYILIHLLFKYNFYSSVQLLGDLLFRISGVSGKMSTETASDDDNFGTEQSHKVHTFLY